jgi:hypothetical protein
MRPQAPLGFAGFPRGYFLPAQFQLTAFLSLLTFAMRLFHVLSCGFPVMAAQDSPKSPARLR